MPLITLRQVGYGGIEGGNCEGVAIIRGCSLNVAFDSINVSRHLYRSNELR
jgi:hypothetical protein